MQLILVIIIITIRAVNNFIVFRSPHRKRKRDVTLSCFDRIPIAIFLFRVLRSCSVGVVLLEAEAKVYYSSTTIPAGVNQEYGRMIFTGTVFEEVHYIHVLYPWGLE